jgi:hypothetical protein
MPELLTERGAARSLTDTITGPIAHTIPSVPTGALDNPPQEQPEPRFLIDIAHVAQKLDDLNDRIAALVDIEQAALADRVKERTFIDAMVNISEHVEYTVDYHGRKFLYLFSAVSLNIALSTGGTLTIPANMWQGINFPRGTKITIPTQADAAPAVVYIRASDTPMPVGAISVADISNPNIQVANNTATAGTNNVVTLTGVAGKMIKLYGIVVNVAPAATAANISLVITGLAGGTVTSYIYNPTSGAGFQNTQFSFEPAMPIPASAVGGNIVVTLNAGSGTGESAIIVEYSIE